MVISLGCLAAFLLGAVPFALVLVRLLAGVDLRMVGSGNPGATNASRAFGPRTGLGIFLLIYLLDAGKGFVPTRFGPQLMDMNSLLTAVLLGLCAILGHCYSPFLGFRGGKGVATTTGVFLALDPLAVAIAIGVFLAVRVLTGQVFLGSLTLGVALLLAVILRDPTTAFSGRLPVTCLALMVAGLFFYTHRSNIRGFRSAAKAPS